jgi:hypothetical protein
LFPYFKILLKYKKKYLRINLNLDCKAIEVSLGCFFLWPIAKQREAMNPVPATTRVIRNGCSFFMQYTQVYNGYSSVLVVKQFKI